MPIWFQWVVFVVMVVQALWWSYAGTSIAWHKSLRSFNAALLVDFFAAVTLWVLACLTLWFIAGGGK